jgi:hypothetical protein
MANEERVGSNLPKQPDRADEVQRRIEPPVAPPQPPQPPLNRDRMSEFATTGDAVAREAAATAGEALFPAAESTRFRSQWTEIQAAFVDEPKSAVKRADALVGDVLKNLSETFARERSKLESQWDRDGDVSTEDFRIALRRYRAFFDRLLAI